MFLKIYVLIDFFNIIFNKNSKTITNFFENLLTIFTNIKKVFIVSDGDSPNANFLPKKLQSNKYLEVIGHLIGIIFQKKKKL